MRRERKARHHVAALANEARQPVALAADVAGGEQGLGKLHRHRIAITHDRRAWRDAHPTDERRGRRRQRAAISWMLRKRTRGSADVTTEQLTGQPVLTVAIDREAVARHGIKIADGTETRIIFLGFDQHNLDRWRSRANGPTRWRRSNGR